MPSPETQRVRPIKEIVKEFDKTYIIHCSDGDILDGMVSGGAVRRWLRNTITQDRQHILEVLNQSLVEKQFDPETTVKELVDPDGVNGYNYAVKQFKALLQETLGEGKEI